VPSHSCESVSWIVLLEGANKLGLNTFRTALGDYLIKQHEQWIKQNILTVYDYAMSTNSLQRLGDYCNQLMLSSPDIILKSDNMGDLPKATFISLLKNDELNMDEGDVWMSVVQWAVNQIAGLTDNPTSWSTNDVDAVKDIIAECIPHIRFFNMSAEVFNEKVAPFIELLPRELRSDLLSYYLQKNYKPKTQMLPQRKGQQPDINIDSVVINKQQASWILQKIAESTQTDRVEQGPVREQTVSYKLTLLYRESRDNSDNYDEKTIAKKFRQMCTNKGPTVAVGRVKDTGEILGGYNPLSWSSSNDGYISTKESFIFSLDKNDVEKNIISFVKKEQTHVAIYEYPGGLPYFGNSALFFGGFYKGTLYKPVARNNGYYQLPIRSTDERFTWADWEVFSVDKSVV
jgi:hypothetical protein